MFLNARTAVQSKSCGETGEKTVGAQKVGGLFLIRRVKTGGWTESVPSASVRAATPELVAHLV